MNTQQIEAQINNDLEKFKETVYKGTIKVPENIIFLFKKGIVHLAPQFHKLNFTRVKQLVVKKSNELTVGDLTDVARIILNTPFDVLYGEQDLFSSSFNDSINDQIKLEKFMLSYNLFIDEFQQRLQQKRATLASLSHNNKMRVIN